MVVVCKRCGGVPCVCPFLEEAGILRRSRPEPTAMEKLMRRVERIERIVERKRTKRGSAP